MLVAQELRNYDLQNFVEESRKAKQIISNIAVPRNEYILQQFIILNSRETCAFFSLGKTYTADFSFI